jgi:NADPH:quinone reductase-like Zn-dependent oxidoreductase
MKAIRIHTYGGPETLKFEDAPEPQPASGEVLIRVHATTVNPFDCAVRSGYMTGYFQHTLPLILGTDVSGVIEAVGADVTDLRPGDEVYTRAGVVRDGAYAELVVAPAADVVAKPKTLDHVHAAALPHVTLTAWHALFDLADLQAGQTVLIHGAGGGVGHIAVQLAKLRGAKVIGTASTNYDMLEELGVDQAINHATTAFESIVHDVDVVLDTVGDETQERSWQTLKPGGILVSVIQPPSEETAKAYGVRQAMVYTNPPIGPTLAKVAELVDAGKLMPIACIIFPLQEIQEAHQLIESRHSGGKVVMQVA